MALIRSFLVLPAALLMLGGCDDDKDKKDPMAAQIAETCKCLNSGDFLAAMDCEKVHADTLAALKKPELAERLEKGVDECRPKEPGG